MTSQRIAEIRKGATDPETRELCDLAEVTLRSRAAAAARVQQFRNRKGGKPAETTKPAYPATLRHLQPQFRAAKKK